MRAFIESFIAPDMHMRPLGQTIALLEEAGLATIAVEAMREHYVRTVDMWIDNLESHWAAAVALIGEEAARVWRLYLAGGRLTFTQGRMGVDSSGGVDANRRRAASDPIAQAGFVTRVGQARRPERR